MNILLWIIQSILALFCVAGGATKVFKIDELLTQPSMSALPRKGWQFLGLVEVIAGILLILPAAMGWMPELTPFAASIIAVENVLVSAIYARHSTKITASNPLIWTFIIALLAITVSYGRYVISPFS